MFKRIYLLIALLAASLLSASGQRPLFSVGGGSVYPGEFLHEHPEFLSGGDTAGLCEALARYADYRAEVCEARRLRLDTTSSFRRAMRYHSGQQYAAHILSSPMAQSILQEILSHSQYLYRVSYIRLDIYANSHGDTASAYGKASRARGRILQGQDFEMVARQTSDDPKAKINGGYLGWVSPIDINAGHEVLKYVFSHFADSSEVSAPIRSGQSYYIVRAGGRRAAIDSVSVSPIIIRKKLSQKLNDSLARLAGDIMGKLESGQDFTAMQVEFSDIKFSESLPLGLAYRKYSTHLLDGPENGSLSPVIETPDYFCIARIDRRHNLEAGADYRGAMMRRMAGTVIFKDMSEYFLDSIKSISGYSQKGTLAPICRLMPDSAIFEARWNPGDLKHLAQSLLVFNGKDYSYADFAEYIYKNQYKTGYSKIPEYVKQRYSEFVDQIAINEAQQYLMGHDPEYKRGMDAGERQALISMLRSQGHYPKARASRNQALQYYKDSGLSLKTSHAVTMKIYDYKQESAKKKALRAAEMLASDSAAASQIASVSAMGTFVLGMNSAADEIISGFDSGLYKWPDSRIIFMDSIHSFAVISGIQEPEPLSDSEIYSIVAAQCARKQRDEWIERIRSQHGLVMEPDACGILAEEIIMQ